MYPNVYPMQQNYINNSKKSKPINWNDLLDSTQKTLSIINQAIPIFYQIKPLISNAKVMFKIVDALNMNNSSNLNTKNYNSYDNLNSKSNNFNRPIFYV